MSWRQLLLMHSGAVEQRWSEVAWLCHVWVNCQRTSKDDPVHLPAEYNPIRLAEQAALQQAQPSARSPGGIPLDRETVRAFHRALKARRLAREARPG